MTSAINARNSTVLIRVCIRDGRCLIGYRKRADLDFFDDGDGPSAHEKDGPCIPLRCGERGFTVDNLERISQGPLTLVVRVEIRESIRLVRNDSFDEPDRVVAADSSLESVFAAEKTQPESLT